MHRRLARLHMLPISLVVSSLICAAGCRDVPTAAGAATSSGAAKFIATAICSVDVQAGHSHCQLVNGPLPTGQGFRRIVVPDAQAMVETGADSYTPTDSTYRLDIRLVNTSANELGTRDGTTVTGIKAFIPVNVMGYAGRPPGDTTMPYPFLIPPLPNINNLVHARDPDGTMAFTGPNQPYWNYAEKLAPGDTTQWREWKFTLDPSVSYFYFAVGVFAAVPGEQAVPLSIPEEARQPSRYYDPQYQVDCSKLAIPKCVYDVVDVIFNGSASQDERQAAVDAIGGTMESGNRFGGTYYIRIPADTTLAAVQAAIAILNELPQVKLASPHEMGGLSLQYLRPSDGANWRSWQLRDSLADDNRRTWALEAISAPSAWGCETGSTSTMVAVIDSDIENVSDLSPNLDSNGFGLGMLVGAGDTLEHGTSAASIIAAEGNNGSGITGTMWTAHVRSYDVAEWDQSTHRPIHFLIPGTSDSVTQIDMAAVVRNVVNAAADGAGVINISISTNWSERAKVLGWISSGNYDPAREHNAIRDSLNRALVQKNVQSFSEAMDTLNARNLHPLVVLSAGNDEVDAWWSGYSQAAATYNSVLVVGAVRDAGNGRLAPMHLTVGGTTYGSDYGNLVQIAAPGQNVWALNRNGEKQVNGTSFAAPYVTGIAGLLLAFDPRLNQHPDTLKQLLIQGAINGRRRIVNGAAPDSIPVLHAYEALKAAARRHGAPLCGTRVAGGASGTIVVLRDSAAGTTETIVTGADSVWEVNPLHGGKRLIAATGQDYLYHEYVWNSNGTWSQAATDPNDDVPPGSAGTALSWFGRSHDYSTGNTSKDTSVMVSNIAGNDSSATYRISFQAGTGSGRTTYATKDFDVPRLRTDTSRIIHYCAYEYLNATNTPTDPDAAAAWDSLEAHSLKAPACWVEAGYNPEARWEDIPGVAYSPSGDSAYIVVNFQHLVENAPAFAACERTLPFVWNNDTTVVTLHLRCGNGSGLRWSDSRTVYAVAIPRSSSVGSLRQLTLWNEPLANIGYYAVSESGREWVADYAQDSVSYWFIGSNPPVPSVEEYQHRTCTTRFQSLSTGSAAWTVNACNLWRGGFTAGMSPIRGASHILASSPRAVRVNGQLRAEHGLSPNTTLREGPVTIWRTWNHLKPELIRQLSAGVLRAQ